MLDGVDAAERRTWDVMPNISSRGKLPVSRYTSSTARCAFCQTSNCSNDVAAIWILLLSYRTLLSSGFWLLASGLSSDSGCWSHGMDLEKSTPSSKVNHLRAWGPGVETTRRL